MNSKRMNLATSCKSRGVIVGILLISLLVSTLSACSVATKPNKKNEKRVVENIHALPFDKVELRGVADVYYTQDTVFSIKMYGYPKDLAKVKLNWKGSRLVIDMKKKGIKEKVELDENIVVRLSSPDLLMIEHRGVGDFYSKTLINTDTLKVEQKGVGDISFEGLVCDRLLVNLKGVGDFTAKKVKAQQSFILSKGVGEVDVNFLQCDNLDVQSYGVGDIVISGSVRNVSKTSRGVGNVKVCK